MSDWAQRAADDLLRPDGNVVARLRAHVAPPLLQDLGQDIANALREHHARGLREGAAAERQRAAGVCEAKRAEWAGTGRHYTAAMAAGEIRDAILRGGPEADSRTVEQVEAGKRSVGGCCDKNADQHACDCLEQARAREVAAKIVASPKSLDQLKERLESEDIEAWADQLSKSLVEHAETNREADALFAVPSLCPALRPRTLTQAQADDLKAFRERSEAKAKRCPCGGEYRPLKKDHFPVPLSACIKCGADGPPWSDVVGETPGVGPEKPTVAERVITRLDDFAKRLEDVPDDIRCENCGAPLDLLDTSWRSAGETLWEHRCPNMHPQAGSFRGVPAGQPHGPSVAADPGEGSCGTCRYFISSLSATSGYCRIVREGNVIYAGRVAGLTQTTADLGCDCGAWRAKGE